MLGALVARNEIDRRARAVLEFWFGELHEGFAANPVRESWFNATAERDRTIAERFGELVSAAAANGLSEWRRSPREALALILVCDQFSRQIHRGTPAAFATDALALETAGALVASGDDTVLAFDERVFIYLPFEHAESRLDQHVSVGLFSLLRDLTPPGKKHLTGVFLQHAHQHRDIVLRFGRFPHRNALLGRPSTAEELEFLAEAGDFGQSPRPGPGKGQDSTA